MDKKYKSLAYQGIIGENPTFKMALGLCPTLAMTKSLSSALGIAVATVVVLVLTNMAISLLKKAILPQVRIPSYIIIIATIATVLEMLMRKFMPELHSTLGIFIPLIVVNCIVFARAEIFASKSGIVSSMLDALFTGIGFILSLSVIGIIREILGSGTILGAKLLPEFFPKLQILVQPAGGFLVLGLLMALYTLCTLPKKEKKETVVASKTVKEEAI